MEKSCLRAKIVFKRGSDKCQKMSRTMYLNGPILGLSPIGFPVRPQKYFYHDVKLLQIDDISQVIGVLSKDYS